MIKFGLLKWNQQYCEKNQKHFTELITKKGVEKQQPESHAIEHVAQDICCFCSLGRLMEMDIM